MVAGAGSAGVDTPTLAARVTVPRAALAAALRSETDVVALGPGPSAYLSREALLGLGQAVLARLRRFHRDSPLKAAMPREELRRSLFARSPEAAFERVLAALAEKGEVRLLPETVALARHEVTLTPAEAEARRLLLEAAEAAGLAGIEVGALAARAGKEAPLLERVSRVLVEERSLSRVGEGLLVHRNHLESLKRSVRERWRPGSRLDVGEFKELTGLTRKFVIPLLEYLDRERVTRRAGGERLVLAGEAEG
jgi:selenocysteine-specific elongation factor